MLFFTYLLFTKLAANDNFRGMKNLFSSTLVLLAMFTLQPKKAEAGLAIGAIAGDAGAGAAIGAIVGGGGMILLCTITGAGKDGFSGPLFGILMGIPTAGIGALLDVDASLNQEVLAKGFKTQYPFLNNAEALSSLASLAKTKFHEGALAHPEEKSYLVRFTHLEVAQALAGASISPEQFAQISNDLQ